MNAQELLEELNALDEHEQIEAKRGEEVGKSVLETVCAFANEPALGGGRILLGVSRNDLTPSPSYHVKGLEKPDKISADLASQCTSVFNRPLRVDITTERLDDKAVIVVYVAESPAQNKPIFFKKRGLPNGAFRRIGSSDQHCTEDDLIALYQERRQESFDAGIVPDAEFEDFSTEAIADYRQTRAEANPDAEELRWRDQELMQALGCLRRNKQGRWQPTVAGMILFGKPTGLRRCFPMTRVDYIRVPGRDWIPDPEHRFDTIELRDPLFRLIRRAQAAILDDLPKAFGLEERALQREDRPVIPLRVIREALVNALMHRSYRSHGPVQIVRYANRLEIRNPGFSLKSPEHLGEPGSLPRNPKIAAVLHETRFAETKGSGIRVMRDMAAKAGLTPPLFESDRGGDQFIARFFFHHFLGEDDIRWLSRFKDLHLSEDEARGLVVAREAGAIDNATYRELNKVDTLAASTALRRLRNAGLLAQKGRGSATWYRPTDTLIGNNEGLPASSESLSSNLGVLSSNLGTLSSNPAPIYGTRDDQERRNLLNELPGELAARIGAIGKRHPPETVRSLVVELCRLHQWRVEELATILGRRPETVRQDYLRPLMREGSIVMTRPEVPNDPEQAYRTVENKE